MLKVMWLPSFSQLNLFISAYHIYATLKLVYDWLQFHNVVNLHQSSYIGKHVGVQCWTYFEDFAINWSLMNEFPNKPNVFEWTGSNRFQPGLQAHGILKMQHGSQDLGFPDPTYFRSLTDPLFCSTNLPSSQRDQETVPKRVPTFFPDILCQCDAIRMSNGSEHKKDDPFHFTPHRKTVTY